MNQLLGRRRRSNKNQIYTHIYKGRIYASEEIVYSYDRIGNPETDLPSIKIPNTETANSKEKKNIQPN